MVFDLGKAMHKKAEFESARLVDFAFRRRARAARLLAARYALDEAALVARVALTDDAGIIDTVCDATGAPHAEVAAAHAACTAAAHAALVRERGDPRPHRLA